MLNVTDAARERIAAMLSDREEKDLVLRVAIRGHRFGRFIYDLSFVGAAERAEGDVVVRAGDLEVLVDAESAGDLEGAKLDYLETDGMSGFGIENPNPVWDDPTAQKVQKVLDEEVNPGLRMHRGMVSLVEVKDGVAYVAFGGGCQGCGLVDVTLRDGVEVRIKEAVPEIQSVVDTTDHGRGTDPFQ